MKRDIFRLVYPRKCPGCMKVIPADLLVCSECAARFIYVEPPYCMKCGRHIGDPERELCGQCMEHERSFSMGFAVFEYDSLMRRSMSEFKFHGMSENAEFYAAAAIKRYRDRILEFRPDVIVPVPSHRSRRMRRGYNQAELIADHLSRGLGIPVQPELLVRNKRTVFQKLLRAGERARNLDNAFSYNRVSFDRETVRDRFERVLLVDDIFTTGSTMQKCTEALKSAGVTEVAVLSICIGQGYM